MEKPANTKKKETGKVDTSHLGHGRYQQEDEDKPTPQPVAATVGAADEDWGEGEDEELNEQEVGDLEEELTEQTTTPTAPVAEGKTLPQQEKTVTATANAPANVPAQTAAPTTPVSAQNFMELMKQLQEAQAQAVAGVDAEIAQKEQQKETLDKEIEVLKTQKNTILGWHGGSPNGNVPSHRGRRGRRSRVSPEPAKESGSTRKTATTRRSRPKNDKTLKEAIVEVLTKKGRIDLNTITNDIEKSGYKTNSKKFTNTVRVQLYRLDDDGEITIYDDGTYSLRK